MAGEDQRGRREKWDDEERGPETEMAEDGEEEEKTGRARRRKLRDVAERLEGLMKKRNY